MLEKPFVSHLQESVSPPKKPVVNNLESLFLDSQMIDYPDSAFIIIKMIAAPFCTLIKYEALR